MKFGSSFTDFYILKQVLVIVSGYIQTWHFYRTLSSGLLFFFLDSVHNNKRVVTVTIKCYS